MPKILLPHQAECFDSVIRQFKNGARAQVQMACGTGKTLVGLRLAEKVCPGRALILVQAPTLELLDQIATEWSENKLNAVWDIAGVGTRLGNYPASTDAEEIAKWMTECNHLVLFATYTSSPCLRDAQAIAKRNFDLGIFDEAHRTTQKESAAFSTCLDDSNVKIRLRFFKTATPRHIIEMDGETSYYSMDDQTAYGPRVYSLSLNRAVEENIVCHYRVLVPVIFGQDTLRSRAEARRDADRFSADPRPWPQAQVAAIEKAIADWKVKKIITFHRTIEDCEGFSAAWNDTRQPDDKIFAAAIHSGMSLKDRQQRLADFSEKSGCILSNPHLLGEGVNVPSTDMAVLLSNIQSPIRTAQILGRVLRRDPANPKKRVGYLMVPIFVSGSTSVADVQDEAALGPLWDILECLLEQTEGFEKVEKRAEFEAAIREVMDHVDFFSPWGEVTREKIDALKNRVVVQWVERLTTKWDDHFEELLRFKEAYGHAYLTLEDGKTKGRNNRWRGLVEWSKRQREAFEAKTLRADRQKRLEKHEFVFTPNDVERDKASRLEWLHLSETLGTKALPTRYGTLPAPWACTHLKHYGLAQLRAPWPDNHAEECERFQRLILWAARARRNVTLKDRGGMEQDGFVFNPKDAFRQFSQVAGKSEMPAWLQEIHRREMLVTPQME
jgi:predicted helicase